MFANLLAIFAAVLVFGAIIFFHELGHFLVAKRAGVLIHEFSIGMGPVVWSKEKEGILYSLRLLPVGGFVMLEGDDEESEGERSLSRQSYWTQIKVFAAGAVMNLIMGYLLLVILVMMSGVVGTTMVSRVDEGTAAHGILQAEDKIIRINGGRVFTSNDITQQFLRDRDGYIEFDVVRQGETIKNIPVQFQMTELEEGIFAINLDFKVYGKQASFVDYVVYPINWGISIVKQVWGSLVDLATGRYTINQLSGPVGVTSVIVTASKMGIDSLLYMAALIAINIGVFNLLPLPILDGGKILFLVIEMISGKKISRKFIERITVASVVLLIALMAYVTVNDVFKLFQ